MALAAYEYRRRGAPKVHPYAKKNAEVGTTAFGCDVAGAYLALDFMGSRNRKSKSTLRGKGVSVDFGFFVIFAIFAKNASKVCWRFLAIWSILGVERRGIFSRNRQK